MAAGGTARGTGRWRPRWAGSGSPPSCSTCSRPRRRPPTGATGRFRFDVELLAGRLLATADWLAAARPTAGLPVGLFGASTGAGAALLAAAEQPQAVAAVVSRGGRPDLAGAALGRVQAPTLLIVGASTRTCWSSTALPWTACGPRRA